MASAVDAAAAAAAEEAADLEAEAEIEAEARGADERRRQWEEAKAEARAAEREAAKAEARIGVLAGQLDMESKRLQVAEGRARKLEQDLHEQTRVRHDLELKVAVLSAVATGATGSGPGSESRLGLKPGLRLPRRPRRRSRLSST